MQLMVFAITLRRLFLGGKVRCMLYFLFGIMQLCTRCMLIQAFLCLVRHCRRKAVKGLRFDNPVYRNKCEEDQFTLNMARHHAASSPPPPVVRIINTQY